MVGQAEGEYISVLDWPFQSHLEVEVHTDHGEYCEETFKYNSRSPAKAINRVSYDERNVLGQGCVRCIQHDEIQPLPSQLRFRVCSVTINS